MQSFWLKKQFCRVMFSLRKKLRREVFLWCLIKTIRLCAVDSGTHRIYYQCFATTSGWRLAKYSFAYQLTLYMLGLLCTRPSLRRGFVIRHLVSPGIHVLLWLAIFAFIFRIRIVWLDSNRRNRTLRNHYGYCSNFQGYEHGHLLVCKDFLYGIVFEQCAERSWSDRIKRGIDTELTAVTVWPTSESHGRRQGRRFTKENGVPWWRKALHLARSRCGSRYNLLVTSGDIGADRCFGSRNSHGRAKTDSYRKG